MDICVVEYVHVCLCVDMSTHAWIYMHVGRCVCVHVSIYVWTCVYVYVTRYVCGLCLYVYIHVHVYICVYYVHMILFVLQSMPKHHKCDKCHGDHRKEEFMQATFSEKKKKLTFLHRVNWKTHSYKTSDLVCTLTNNIHLLTASIKLDVSFSWSDISSVMSERQFLF